MKNIFKNFSMKQLRLLREEACIGDEWRELVTQVVKTEASNSSYQTENYMLIDSTTMQEFVEDMLIDNVTLMSVIFSHHLADLLNISINSADALREVGNDQDMYNLVNTIDGFSDLAERLIDNDDHLFLMGAQNDDYIEIDDARNGKGDWILIRI